MSLIADDEIPTAIRHHELGLDIFVAREFVEAGDDEVGFKKPVTGPGRLQFIVGEDLEGELEAPVKFVLPLFGKAPGTDDKAAI